MLDIILLIAFLAIAFNIIFLSSFWTILFLIPLALMIFSILRRRAPRRRTYVDPMSRENQDDGSEPTSAYVNQDPDIRSSRRS